MSISWWFCSRTTYRGIHNLRRKCMLNNSVVLFYFSLTEKSNMVICSFSVLFQIYWADKEKLLLTDCLTSLITATWTDKRTDLDYIYKKRCSVGLHTEHSVKWTKSRKYSQRGHLYFIPLILTFESILREPQRCCPLWQCLFLLIKIKAICKAAVSCRKCQAHSGSNIRGTQSCIPLSTYSILKCLFQTCHKGHFKVNRYAVCIAEPLRSHTRLVLWRQWPEHFKNRFAGSQHIWIDFKQWCST